MFARTPRLTLRPLWPEDAEALAMALGEEQVARMLARVPHPYTLLEAERRAVRPRGAEEPRFAIMALDGPAPMLVGGIGLADHGDGAELDYWLTPAAWGRGYATEAGRAVIEMARHALPLDRITAWHFVDNPASGRVLRKLGFRPTGITTMRRSAARPDMAAATEYTLDLAEDDRALPIAA